MSASDRIGFGGSGGAEETVSGFINLESGVGAGAGAGAGERFTEIEAAEAGRR